jgi:hypothetical protein
MRARGRMFQGRFVRINSQVLCYLEANLIVVQYIGP